MNARPPATVVDRSVAPGLRERKKQLARTAMTEAALELFGEHGYEATTLEQLVDRAGVSLRTFFRYFDSKVAVALAAEQDLWDALLTHARVAPLRGPLLAVLRRALLEAVDAMDEDWDRRFLWTRGVAARSPDLADASSLLTLRVQRRLIGTLEQRTGLDSRTDVQLRLLCDMVLSAWRAGAQNWVRQGRRARLADLSPQPRDELSQLVAAAFDALEDSLRLTVTA